MDIEEKLNNLTGEENDMKEPKSICVAATPTTKELKRIGKFHHIIPVGDAVGIFFFNCRNSYKRHMDKWNTIAPIYLK